MPKWVKKWKVPSWTKHPTAPDGNYTVSLGLGGEWGCSCPRWKFKREECHHILEVKAQLHWIDGNNTELIKLIALRIENLKAKGKTEKQIEIDLQETFLQGELFRNVDAV